MIKNRVFCRKIKIAVLEEDKEKKSKSYQYLRDMQYHTWKLANKIMQGQYVAKMLPEIIIYNHPEDYKIYKEIELQIANLNKIKKKSDEEKQLKKSLYEQLKEFKVKYKDEISAFFRNQSIQNFTYSLNGEEFRDLLPSTIRTSLNQKVYKDFNNAYKRFSNGEIKLQSYKRTIPVPFQANAINKLNLSVDENNKQQYIFNLFGIEFICLLGRDGNNTKYILDQLIDGTGNFKLNDSSFSFVKNELFLNISLTTNVIKTKKNPNIIAGIDLGVSRMATLVIRDISTKNTNNYIERKFYGDKSFMDRAMAASYRLKNTNQYVLAKTGKGRLHAQKNKISKLSKFENFRDNFNKKIAHHIIQRCIANNVGIIHLESLSSSIGDKNFFMKNWPYSDLQIKIANKAAEYGIDVIKINPAYTSQKCAACGHIDSNNRVNQIEFDCTNCDHKANADVNAAINIANYV